MSSKRITVPADQIKRRCICRQCGQEKYSSDAKPGRERDMHTRNEDENHREHVYPHPDSWEP